MSASINSVRRPERARLAANCVAVVVLPSRGSALVTITTRGGSTGRGMDQRGARAVDAFGHQGLEHGAGPCRP